MSLETRLTAFSSRLATEFRSVKTMITGTATGDLSGLSTTDKSSIIAAINEAATTGGGGGNPQAVDEFYAQAVLDLPFDADFTDQSDAATAVTTNGTPTLVADSVSSNAARFDAGDYLSVASNVLQFGTEDFCIEGWFKPDATVSPFGVIFTKGVNVAGSVSLYLGDSQVMFRVGASSDLTVNTGLPSTEYTHVAFTRQGLTRRIFIDGTQAASDTLSFDVTDTSTAEIGSATTGINPIYAYEGLIDSFRVTRGTAKYTEDFTPSPTLEYSTVDVPAELAALRTMISGSATGDISGLTTTDQTSLVAAINELDGELGDLTTLSTTDKTTLVAAINEVSTQAQATQQTPFDCYLDSSTLNPSDGQAASWDDADSGISATQVSAANQPAIIADAIAGYPALRFDGSSTWLDLSAANSLIQSADRFVMLAVALVGEGGDAYGGVVGATVNTSNNTRAGIYESAASIEAGFRTTDAGTYLNATLAGITGWRLLVADFDYAAGATTLKNAGVNTQTTFTAAQFPASVPQFFEIGRVASGFFAQADIAAVVLLRNPTDDMLATAEGHLAHKFGLQAQLPSGHPYETTPPAVDDLGNTNADFAAYFNGQLI